VVRRLQQEVLKLNKKLGLEEKLPIINVDEVLYYTLHSLMWRASNPICNFFQETELKMQLMQKDKENKMLSSTLDVCSPIPSADFCSQIRPR